MTVINPQSPIAVTGASGYIASWIVSKLLAKGHTVHATVRDPNKASSVDHLLAAAKDSKGVLKLFKADLLQPEGFVAAFAGCELVIHTASPFIIKGYSDAYAALVKPAVEGTRNVLQAVNATESVKRVVLTSSVAAVFGDNADVVDAPNATFDETMWNSSSSLTHQPYSYSKTQAEKAAWEMVAAQQRWDLVTINPALVVGRSLTDSSMSGSMEVMKQFDDNSLRFGAPDLRIGLVDVQDVADAHINAGFTPSAQGRHILSAKVMSLMQIGKVIKTAYGSKYPTPPMVSPKWMVAAIAPLVGFSRFFIQQNVGFDIAINGTKATNALAIRYHCPEDAIVGLFGQLIDDGAIKRR